MALRVKLPILDTRVVFHADGAASPETIGKAFAAMVAADIARIDAENAAAAGYRLPKKTFVGSSERNPLPSFIDPKESVRARWDVGVGAVAYAFNLLANSGPVRGGDYRKLRRIYADGRRVSRPEDTLGAREVMILSVVPYARKIEHGKKGYRPGNVYQAVAAITAAKFGNVGRIKFTFAEPPDDAGPLDRWAHRNAALVRHPHKRRRKLMVNRRQPAILFYLG